MPASYELVSQRKGFKRYKSSRLAELLQEHAAAQDEREAALSSVLQVRLLHPDNAARAVLAKRNCSKDCRRATRLGTKRVSLLCILAAVSRATALFK